MIGELHLAVVVLDGAVVGEQSRVELHDVEQDSLLVAHCLGVGGVALPEPVDDEPVLQRRGESASRS